MQKIRNLFVALIVVMSLVIPNIITEAAGKQFSDVSKGHWAAKEVYHFVDKGVISGYGDGTFGPDNHITREQAAIMLTKVLDLDVPDSQEVTKYFDDVKADQANADKIAAISKAGIMRGSDRQFRPYDNLTREQMATVLVKGFNLQADNEVDIYLGNVSESHHEGVQQLANLGITNQLEDFRPAENGTRVHFVVMLDRVMESSEDLSHLLKEVYANEMKLNSYEMEGSLNFGMSLPDLGEESPEFDLIADMLEDIKVDITGAYQKDPMLLEAKVDVSLQLDSQVETTISIPMIISEEKMWMKMPQIPGEDIPEEIKDKFIEIDLNVLPEQQGIDMNAQFEFAEAVQNLFIDHFAIDYYYKVGVNDYDVPADLGVEKVIKFNLNDEDLEPFMKTMLTSFLPELFEIMEEPEYANAMGLTVEEVKEAQEELEIVFEDIDEIISMLSDVLQINSFEEYIGINGNNIIVSDDLNLDIDIKADDETFGFTLISNQVKRNINGNVSIELPAEEDIVPFEQLLDIVEEEVEIIQ